MLYCDSVLVETTHYTPDTYTSPLEAIIEAIANATDRDPDTLPPIYDYVNPDALNAFITDHTEEGALEFAFETWTVYVRTDGRIRVYDTTQTTTPRPVFEASRTDSIA